MHAFSLKGVYIPVNHSAAVEIMEAKRNLRGHILALCVPVKYVGTQPDIPLQRTVQVSPLSQDRMQAMRNPCNVDTLWMLTQRCVYLYERENGIKSGVEPVGRIAPGRTGIVKTEICFDSERGMELGIDCRINL